MQFGYKEGYATTVFQKGISYYLNNGRCTFTYLMLLKRLIVCIIIQYLDQT